MRKAHVAERITSRMHGLCWPLAVVVMAAVAGCGSGGSSRADHHTKANTRTVTVTRPAFTRPAATSDSLATFGTVTVPGAAGGPSGVPLPTGSPAGWKRVFADAFPASEDAPLGSFSGCKWVVPAALSGCSGLPPKAAEKWFAEPQDGSEIPPSYGFMSSKVISIEHGELDFSLHGGPGGAAVLAAAEPRVAAAGPLRAFRAGMFAVRFRADRVKGYNVALELWPLTANPQDGSIQFPAGSLTGSIDAILGRPDVPYGNPNVVFSSHKGFSTWHTAVMIWLPGEVEFFLDGRRIAVQHQFIPSAPMRWLLYVGPPPTGEPKTGSGTGHLDVAWLAAYTRKA